MTIFKQGEYYTALHTPPLAAGRMMMIFKCNICALQCFQIILLSPSRKGRFGILLQKRHLAPEAMRQAPFPGYILRYGSLMIYDRFTSWK